MNNKAITIISIIIILLLAGSIIYFKNFQGKTISNSLETEAKWIGNHSVLYVQTGCSHCKDQEALFGENIKYLTIIDESNPQAFIEAGIEATPTWVINGQKYIGVQSIEKLKELTEYQD
jgi:glutaredoxin